MVRVDSLGLPVVGIDGENKELGAKSQFFWETAKSSVDFLAF